MKQEWKKEKRKKEREKKETQRKRKDDDDDGQEEEEEEEESISTQPSENIRWNKSVALINLRFVRGFRFCNMEK